MGKTDVKWPLLCASWSLALAVSSFSGYVSADVSLQNILNKVQQSQSISQDEARMLLNAARTNELQPLVPKDDAHALADQLDRYGLEGVSAAVRSYGSSYVLVDQLASSAPPIIRDQHDEEFLSEVDFYTDQFGLETHNQTQLVVVEHDGRVLKVDDPVAGENLEVIALSCFYHSGSASHGTPTQRYGTDMLLFDEPQRTGILFREQQEGEWIEYVVPYVITRLAVDWEESNQRIRAYVHGYRDRGEYYGVGRQQPIATPSPRWHTYTCGAASVRYEKPIYVPYVESGWNPRPVGNSPSSR